MWNNCVIDCDNFSWFEPFQLKFDNGTVTHRDVHEIPKFRGLARIPTRLHTRRRGTGRRRRTVHARRHRPSQVRLPGIRAGHCYVIQWLGRLLGLSRSPGRPDHMNRLRDCFGSEVDGLGDGRAYQRLQAGSIIHEGRHGLFSVQRQWRPIRLLALGWAVLLVKVGWMSSRCRWSIVHDDCVAVGVERFDWGARCDRRWLWGITRSVG